RLALLAAGRRHRQRADRADAEQRAVQRARDRRRRQRQHVEIGTQLLEALLLAHAEPLLLVDDDQREVAPRELAAEDLVRADDDVDRAREQGGGDRLALRGRPVARQQLDREPERFAAGLERAPVLLRQ